MPPPGGRGFFTHQQSILCLNDGLACQMQVSLFLMRGIQVFPAGLKPIAWVGLLISLFLIFVPPCECPHGAGFFADVSREQLLVACAGLRGAVPITLVRFP